MTPRSTSDAQRHVAALQHAAFPPGVPAERQRHFIARSLAKMHAALANGGEVPAVRLVTPERAFAMQEFQAEQVDAALGAPMRKNTGFFLGGAGRAHTARWFTAHWSTRDVVRSGRGIGRLH